MSSIFRTAEKVFLPKLIPALIAFLIPAVAVSFNPSFGVQVFLPSPSPFLPNLSRTGLALSSSPNFGFARFFPSLSISRDAFSAFFPVCCRPEDAWSEYSDTTSITISLFAIYASPPSIAVISAAKIKALSPSGRSRAFDGNIPVRK